MAESLAPSGPVTCEVCRAPAPALDVVDFNKSCEEARGRFLPLSGRPVYYHFCPRCGFCFAPAFRSWSLADFERDVYNAAYVDVDPDYVEARPRANAASLAAMFAGKEASIRHIDYGGGEGLLSRAMREKGWNSSSYDPFVDRDVAPSTLGKFDLVSAFEVFEHVPDIRQLMASLDALLAEDGVVLFSTLVSDGQLRPGQRIGWWYASPRNGHISLFSRGSLSMLCSQSGFRFGSFSEGFHAMWRTIPPWASHLLRDG